MSCTLTSPSPASTRALGTALAGLVAPGDVLALSGELGAGKTTLVQGLAEGLGHVGRVTSPTFLLARTLPTTPPLVHADAWRLDRVNDLLDLGDEVLDDDVVTVLEWGDAVAAVLPADRLDVALVHATDPVAAGAAAGSGPPAATTDGDAEDALPRRVTLLGRGGWVDRLAAGEDALRTAVGGAPC